MLDFADGVYFDMPETTYHAIPRFSQSGVKDMMVSVSDFWERSWMNPDKAEAKRDDDTLAKLWGRAYHCRLNEGREALLKNYYFAITPADYPDQKIYHTVEDMKTELQALGVAGLSKLKKADCAKALKEHYPHALIWDDMVADHEKANEGRTKIPADWFMRLERAAAFIEKDPGIGPAFKRGVAEVVVLWTKTVTASDGSGRQYKVKMKSRLDYLKFVRNVKEDDGVHDYLTCVDLKNYANSLGRKVDRAVISEAANQRMHIQAACYYEAMDQFIKFVAGGEWYDWSDDLAAGKPSFPEVGPPPMFQGIGPKTKPLMVFIYQKSTGAPVARARKMGRHLSVVEIGRVEIDMACETFAKCLMQFGEDLWIEHSRLEDFEDEQFPQFMVE